MSVGIGSSVHEPLSPGVGGLAKNRHGGIGAQAEPQRLDPDRITWCDIGQVDIAAEMPDKPGLLILPGGLEHNLMRLNDGEQGINHVGSDAAIGVENTYGAAFAPFGQDPRGTGIKIGLR